jgi:competence protein ComEC
MNTCDKYLWTVDNIISSQKCNIFKDDKPFMGFLVHLVKYKENIEENIGHRYIIIDEDLFPDKINFGNTYYISNDITKVIPVKFSEIEYPIRYLIEPPYRTSMLDERIKNSINICISRNINNENIIKSKPEIKYLSKTKKQKIWARIFIHDVGQGDTIILELPNNQIWMIDARFLREKRKVQFDEWMHKKLNKRKLNRLIISHFHYDHIHSVPYVIKNYQPDQIVVSNSLVHSTSCVDKVLQYAGDRLYILPGEEITQFGTLKIQLHRTDKYYSVGKSRNPNDHEISVILKSENGFALLAGDIPGQMCEKLISNSFCDGMKKHKMIYKVSHHGSLTGYDANFFNNISPINSIISCGYGNRYGHPDKFLLNQLQFPTITWQWSEQCMQYQI